MPLWWTKVHHKNYPFRMPEKEMLLEAAYAVRKNGGYFISFICDNCPLNQQTYIQTGGPGRVYLQPDGLQVFLVYDFIRIFKNIRNNWFTEKLKELSFTVIDSFK